MHGEKFKRKRMSKGVCPDWIIPYALVTEREILLTFLLPCFWCGVFLHHYSFCF